MREQTKIFKDELLNAYLKKFDETQISNFDEKWNILKKWKKSCEVGDLQKTKETSVQGLFFSQIFNQVLGYRTLIDGGIYNQSPEFKSTLDGSEADGALGFFNAAQNLRDVRVAIELKGASISLDKKQHRTSHLTPVEQGMSYANKNGSKCGWVIVSNFIETRLYKSDSSLEYESFDIRKMDDKTEFLKFYFLLCKEHLIEENEKSLIDKLYQENEEIGIEISNQFYKEYKEIRTNLYIHLKETNPEKDELLLFTKSQKIMDRFTFICFCEDCGLLPANLYKQLIESSEHSFSFSQTKIWDELRGLFKSIDKGNPPMKINKYNGGLFKEDPDLDNLIIFDEPLKEFIRLSNYNFSSDLNVNILGQIFEQSISDVEQIKNEINGIQSESNGKQKDDGIFYTPYYVTRYIVEQTVGKFLSNAKEKIKYDLFKQGCFKTEVIKKDTGRKNKVDLYHWEEIPSFRPDFTVEEQLHYDAVCNLHLKYWNSYEEILKNIKICDPSCGSGAFLNQCFDYLHEEMDFLLDMKRQFESQISMFDIDKDILQNNLYGVDINPESVEITKLSLWLKTAKKNQTLATLDDNIKCGNSIINCKDTAGELAFDWQAEFPEVFASGGFDIIVGNPPYGAKLSQQEKDYLSANYCTTEYNYDTYKTFFELGFELLKNDGYLGYITPNTFFTLELGANKLRNLLFNKTLCRIVELFNVFPNAVVEPVITIFQNKLPQNEEFTSVCLPRKIKLSSTFLNEGIENKFIQSDLKRDEKLLFNYRSSKEQTVLFEKIKNNVILDSLFHVMTGAKPYQVGKGVPKQTKETVKNKPYTGFVQIDEYWKPYMRGRTIGRCVNKWANTKEFIKYGEWLAEPRNPEVFANEKLFVRQTGDQLITTYDKGNVSNDTLYSIYPKDSNSSMSLLYLLGVMNSSVLNWYYQSENYLEVGKPMAQVKANALKRLPIAIGNCLQCQEVENSTKLLLQYSQKRYDAKLSFVNYLIKVYEPKKISEKLEDFEALSFKEFLDELKKQKVKLTAAQQMELLSLYDEQKSKIQNMSKEINKIHSALDEKVFKIYNISKSEADTIKSSIVVEL